MDHVFQCRHHTAMTLKQQILDDLTEEIYLLGTSKSVTTKILCGLRWWLMESSLDFPRAPGFWQNLSIRRMGNGSLLGPDKNRMGATVTGPCKHFMGRSLH